MSKSSLVNVNVPADKSNYTVGRSGKKIKAITIHHMAGVMSAEQCGAIFKKKGRNGSAHYGIGNDGRIGQYVDESNTAWANSNWNSNCESVTIETSNNKTGGDWTVGDKALKSLIKLVADIAKRNKITLVKGKTLTWHSMFTATTCPGNYLRSKIDYIISEANKINNGETTTKKITFRVGNGHWYDWVSSGGVAGNQTTRIDRFQIKGTNITIPYKAHILKGSWLPEVKKADNTDNGYAGIYGKSIDGIAIGNVKRYRIRTKKGWLPWVTGYNIKDSKNGYAGNLGEEITAVQIKIS